MKTITLTEPAYERLLAWKAKPKESFSAVVLKVVPQRGTLGDALEQVEKMSTMADGFFKAAKEARKEDRKATWERNPWTAAGQ